MSRFNGYSPNQFPFEFEKFPKSVDEKSQQNRFFTEVLDMILTNDFYEKPNLIIYVHGWNSHAKARKAELLISELKDNNNYEVLSVTLKSHPREAIEQLSQIIDKELQERSVHLIGSSLGGYFSCFLAEKHNIKAAI